MGLAAVPWPPGEHLVYTLRYRGLAVGTYAVTATQAGADAWNYVGTLNPTSLARLVGFDFSMESLTGSELTTRRFVKEIRSPFSGQIRLVAEVGKALVGKRFRNGRLEGTYRVARRQVWDDLSLLYYIRANPEATEVAFVGLYGVVKGRLQSIGTQLVRVPAGRFRAQGYRFNTPQAYFELWIAGPGRLPVRVVFGYRDERVEARLLRR